MHFYLFCLGDFLTDTGEWEILSVSGRLRIIRETWHRICCKLKVLENPNNELKILENPCE